MTWSSWSSSYANDRYKPNKPIGFKTSMLRSYLCHFSDAYFVVKGDIALTKAAIEILLIWGTSF